MVSSSCSIGRHIPSRKIERVIKMVLEELTRYLKDIYVFTMRRALKTFSIKEFLTSEKRSRVSLKSLEIVVSHEI